MGGRGSGGQLLTPLGDRPLTGGGVAPGVEVEGIAEAVAEVEGYFSRAAKYPAISRHSLVPGFRDSIACACLLEFWERRSVPLVGFVMCRSAKKRQGLATFALHQTIGRLKRAGYSELRTIITEGNSPSEALFARAGFHRVDYWVAYC